MAGHIKESLDRIALFGVQNILDLVIETQSIREIARAIGVGAPLLTRFLYGSYKLPGETKDQVDDRVNEYRAARRMSAVTHVEDGMEKLMTERDPKAANLAKARAEMKLKLAERFDRETFGTDKGKVEVNVNLHDGSMHINALRRVKQELAAPAAPQLAAPTVEDAVFEVLE